MSSGRINQKLRTKEVLLDAAAQMIREGKPISISEVADRAKVGRTTAYRYFPTSELMVASAALWKVTGRTERSTSHLFKPSMTPVEKLDVVIVQSDRSTHEHRNEYRAMLRASLDPATRDPDRSGIRLSLLKDALAEVKGQLDPETLDLVFNALSLTLGIEAQVVLEDVCKLAPKKAQQIKRWAARALLEAALQQGKSPARPASARKES